MASHDLKEPVRKITFFSHQLKHQLSAHLTDVELCSFDRIENALERMGNLIDDLLVYSYVGQRPYEMERVDLSVKVQRALEDLDLDRINLLIELNKSGLAVLPPVVYLSDLSYTTQKHDSKRVIQTEVNKTATRQPEFNFPDRVSRYRV